MHFYNALSYNRNRMKSSENHNNLQKSSTLNRKYVSRPKISIEEHQEEEEVKDETPAMVEIEVTEPESVVEQPEVALEEPLRSIIAPPSEEIIPRATKIIINAPSEEESPAEESSIAEAFAEPSEEELSEENAAESVAADSPDLPPEEHPYQKIIEQVSLISSKEEGEIIPPPTPRELKNEAIKKALSDLEEQKEEAVISEISAEEERSEASSAAEPEPEAEKPLSKSFRKGKRHSSIAKFIVAFATSAACVGVLGYFVSLNLPSISVRVAAMQTGIEASYPNYIPRGYQLSGVSTGDSGAINITFTGENNASFALVEEKSSWDSAALESNYAKPEWGEDYTTVREQGVTIFISDRSDAAWVNGGILYKLTISSGTLTKKQIKNIALSL